MLSVFPRTSGKAAQVVLMVRDSGDEGARTPVGTRPTEPPRLELPAVLDLVDSPEGPASVPSTPPREAGDCDPDTDVSLLLGKVIVSPSPRGTRRVLHLCGNCYIVPGVGYRSYEVMGDEEPSPSTHKAKYRDCWRRIMPIAPAQACRSPSSTSEASD